VERHRGYGRRVEPKDLVLPVVPRATSDRGTTGTEEIGQERMTASDGSTSLARLGVGRRAVITAVGRATDGAQAGDLERRLLEIGFEEGREVEVRHLGPFGGDPLAVRIDTGVVAIRRKEAAFVLVSPLAPA
jgi:ferrous iron transport protein A